MTRRERDKTPISLNNFGADADWRDAVAEHDHIARFYGLSVGVSMGSQSASFGLY